MRSDCDHEKEPMRECDKQPQGVCCREKASRLIGRLVEQAEVRLAGLKKLQQVAELTGDDTAFDELLWEMAIHLRK